MDARRRSVLGASLASLAAALLPRSTPEAATAQAAGSPEILDTPLEPFSPGAQGSLSALGTLHKAHASLKESPDWENPFRRDYYRHDLDAAIKNKDYTGVLKSLGSQLNIFFDQDIADFGTYYTQLKSFFSDPAGRQEIGEDVHTIKQLQMRKEVLIRGRVSIGGLYDRIWDISNERVGLLEKQFLDGIEDELTKLQKKWGLSGRNELFAFVKSYEYLTAPLAREGDVRDGGQLFDDPVQRRMYKIISDRLSAHFRIKPSHHDLWGTGTITALTSEVYCQYTDMVMASLTGRAGEIGHHISVDNEMRRFYGDFNIDIPNFFANRHVDAQIAAYNERHDYISLYALRPLEIDVSRERLQRLRVPMIRGMNEAERAAYFLEALKRLAPDLADSCRECMEKQEKDSFPQKPPAKPRLRKTVLAQFQKALAGQVAAHVISSSAAALPESISVRTEPATPTPAASTSTQDAAGPACIEDGSAKIEPAGTPRTYAGTIARRGGEAEAWAERTQARDAGTPERSA